MWKFVIIFLPLSTLSSNQIDMNHSRQKRFLIWPPGVSKIQAIVGVGIPVDLQRETVIIGTVMKANYPVPTNLSQLQPEIIFQRRKRRSASRWSIYKVLENVLELRGIQGGKACILRAICELAHKPLDKNFGLYSELTHLIFTPSSTDEEDAMVHYSDSEYYAAQALGKQRGKCDSHFHECTASLMDMFTAYGGEIGF